MDFAGKLVDHPFGVLNQDVLELEHFAHIKDGFIYGCVAWLVKIAFKQLKNVYVLGNTRQGLLSGLDNFLIDHVIVLT